MLVSYLFMMAGGVFIATIAQILLKKSAEKNIDVKSFKEQYINKLVIVGYLLAFYFDVDSTLYLSICASKVWRGD